MVETHNHLLHLLLNPHPLHNLHILQTTEDLMLHLEAHFHAEHAALLDREGVVLEVFESAGLLEVDDDVGAAFDFEAQGEDYYAALVGGVGDGGAAADA